MSDLLHTHLSFGYVQGCPACLLYDQDMAAVTPDPCSCGCGCEPDGDWHWSQRPWCPCLSQGCSCVTDVPTPTVMFG